VKASVLRLLLMALLSACAGRAQPTPQSLVSTAVPPGCSPMHGGIPESPRNPPVWRTGGRLTVVDSSSAPIIVLVVRALDGSPVEGALVNLGPAPVRTIVTDPSGHAAARVPPGRVPVRVLRVGYQPYGDTVTVRGGFADTLRLGLGPDRVCFM
jgi:hypothetical protein